NEYVKLYPDLKILGSRSGYFSDDQEKNDFLMHLAAVDPDIVVVGMGTPFQEEFLVKLTQLRWSGMGFTCGGFFHQTAKKGSSYYPRWVDKLQLRWLYRIWDEPKLIKRYF